MPKPETEIMRQIRDYLRLKGWLVYRNHQTLGSTRGVPDLTAIKDDRAVWIEVKRPGGRLSKHQQRFRDEMLSHCGEHVRYILAYSLEDVVNALTTHAAATRVIAAHHGRDSDGLQAAAPAGPGTGSSGSRPRGTGKTRKIAGARRRGKRSTEGGQATG